jgi:hypothetical protein
VIWAKDRLAGVSFDQRVDLHAARKSLGSAVTVASGWLAELKDAYRLDAAQLFSARSPIRMQPSRH